MNLADVLVGLRRQWWVVLLGVLATAGLAFYAWDAIPAKYEDEASMLLLPPAALLENTTNPYLGLGGLQPATDVLARALNDGELHESLAPSDGTAVFSAYRDTYSSGPLMIIEVSDVTEAGARDTLEAAAAATPALLQKLQDDVGVAAEERIRVVEIARSTEPTIDNKSQIRAVLATAVAGLALTLFGASILDGWLGRRRAQRAAHRAEDPAGSSSAPWHPEEESDDEPAVRTTVWPWVGPVATRPGQPDADEPSVADESDESSSRGEDPPVYRGEQETCEIEGVPALGTPPAGDETFDESSSEASDPTESSGVDSPSSSGSPARSHA